MGRLGCTINGNLNDSKFSEPMPWIGIYVAAASAACAIAMAVDAIHGFRYRKFWFPCKFFSLNATTLTLIAVAIKLSVDLNTSMPHPQDQLAKLSSAVFICTVMGNSLPSLGTMENKEIFMNMVALGILVITAIVNICSPQFVIGRSATCTASGAFCLLSTLTLAEAMLRTYFMPWSFKFCSGDSDYKWSTTLVLITQTIAVVVGTIAPAFRWFTAINFRCPKKAKKACKPQFKVESYWIQSLVEWKECPFALQICGRHGRKLAHNTKNQLLDFCIGMQAGIVLVSKLVRLISIFFESRFLICYRSCSGVKRLLKWNNSVSSNDSVSELQHNPKLDLSRFVLHLEGEEELVDLMMENNCDATGHWIRMGKKKQPKFLIQLLEKSAFSQEFKGVREFDSDQVPSLDSEEPPNCWALPVMTLTSIAVALPNVDHHLIKQLVSSVHEGLVYIRLVENNLNAKEDFINIRKAAEIVWLGVDLYHKWLDVDLRKIALQGKSPKEILEGLADIAKNRFMEFRKKDMNGCLRDSPSRWPIKVLAANSMYRICQTILLDYENRDCKSSETLFERLQTMISDILGACLTNLQKAISMECHHSTIEEREESVRRAVVLLGKTEKILKILDQQPLTSSDPDQMACINEWRILSKQKKPPSFISSSADCDTASSSSDLYLSIE